MSTERPLRRIAVVGLGNVLLGDDGFGPLAIEMFRSLYECDPKVEILDLGTPGLDLAPYLYDVDLVVIADAVHPREEEGPGTLSVYRDDDLVSSQAQLRVTSHDPGVQESLAQLRLAGHAPSEVIVVGVVPESCGLGKGISLSVLDTCLVAVDTIARLLVERSIECRRRHDPIQRNLWWRSGEHGRGNGFDS
ncbi:MAG: hydrogenase maturation protease [Candidatus Sulfotelmatobacter sp.]|jgi:hydrogenase maturation protease